MRVLVASLVGSLALLGACALDGVNPKGSGKGDGGTSDGGVADSGTITGAGCGIERQTGMQLCIATSMCPNVVVDTQAFPSCGFRIRGNVVDLVCGCSSSICPMGVFTNCAQAAALLQSQTEQGVCVQLSEGRCVEAPNPGSSTSSSSSSGGSACDQDCLDRCGGGAACASVCNCN